MKFNVICVKLICTLFLSLVASPILADEDSKTAKAYGVLRDYKLLKLASRQSFLIDPEGRIAKHYADVDPDTHTDEVLADIKAFMVES